MMKPFDKMADQYYSGKITVHQYADAYLNADRNDEERRANQAESNRARDYIEARQRQRAERSQRNLDADAVEQPCES